MKTILFLIAALFAQTLCATGYPLSFNLDLREANKAPLPTLFGASNVWAWEAAVPLQFRLTVSSRHCSPDSCTTRSNPISPKDLSSWTVVLKLLELTKDKQLNF